MKTTYMTPSTDIININPCSMIATSVNVYDSEVGGDDKKGGYNPENSLSNERRGTWGNLWE